MDHLLDSIFSIGSPMTSRISIGPPGVASSKTLAFHIIQFAQLLTERVPAR